MKDVSKPKGVRGVDMSEKTWYEVPTQIDEESGIPRPRYALTGNTVIVYSANRAYVAFENEQDIAAIQELPGVRRLTVADVRDLSQNLPFGLFSGKEEIQEEPNFIGLGDVISWITQKLGIHECEGCRRRKKWLNRVPIWPRWK